VKVGQNFSSRLGRLAAERAGVYYTDSGKVLPDAAYRSYLYRLIGPEIARIVRGLRAALGELGFSNEARIWIADPQNGVMRRVIGSGCRILSNTLPASRCIRVQVGMWAAMSTELARQRYESGLSAYKVWPSHALSHC